MQSKTTVQNLITPITRQQIADEMQISKVEYHGRLTEPDFLMRIFNLKGLPNRDDTRWDNAYDDVYQHTVRNPGDYEDNWIYTDPRINLLHSEDTIYLSFLTNSIHPAVRTNDEEVASLLLIFNKSLEKDGFEIIKTDEISGRPIFSGRKKLLGQAHLMANKIAIKKYLNTEYVANKIATMNDAINKDTALAIGTGKELLETTCKSILKQRGAVIDPLWTLTQLLKATTSALDFKPKDADDPEKAEKSIKTILGGISAIVQGAAELRNEYGTGHGKHSNFKGLESKYAKLFVGVVSEISILYLATNGETAELVE